MSISDERLAELIRAHRNRGHSGKHPGVGIHQDWADWTADLLTELQSFRAAAKVRAIREGDGEDAVMELFVDAMTEADKAMRKFPQPNYVISKVAEEAGEVVKAAIHCAEGRDTPQHVVEEIRQAMAMLIRLYLEGDQVHGLPPIHTTLAASPIPATGGEKE